MGNELPMIDRHDYWSQNRPNGPHALIGRMARADWEGFYYVDLRNAYGDRVDYYACDTYAAALTGATADGAAYFVSEF